MAANHPPIEVMLGFQDTGSEAVTIIVPQYGDLSVGQERTFVEAVRDHEDTGSADGHARRKHGLVHVSAVHALAAEAGERAGVDIDDPSREGFEHAGVDVFEVAGEGDHVDSVFLKGRKHRCTGVAVGSCTDVPVGNSMLLGSIQRMRARVV